MATWTPQSKNTATFTAQSKNTASFTAQQKPTGSPAAAGLYYGFGAFTYSGGQNVGSGGTSWTSVTKS